VAGRKRKKKKRKIKEVKGEVEVRKKIFW